MTTSATAPKSHNSPDPFRDFVSVLSEAGQLLRIEDEVDLRYEVCAFCRHVADDDGPAIFFDRIKGYDMPAVANLFGTRERIALALGVPAKDMARVIVERLKRRISPVLIVAGSARCQETILTGHDVDLKKIPAPYWNVGDGGNYITAGLNIGSHPKWGKNVGIYRNMVRGKNEILAQIAPDHQQRLFYEDMGRGCPMAIVLGATPSSIWPLVPTLRWAILKWRLQARCVVVRLPL